MLKNIFKAGFRSLTKNKTYSFLNIFGLAIGIACAGLIFLWVEDEVNFDSVHMKKNSLYEVQENWAYADGIRTYSSTPGMLGPAMKTEIPGIANTCRATEGSQSLLFSIGNKHVYAGGSFADSSLFDMFTLPFVQGNAKHPFAQPYSIVITEKTARKFFGDEKNIVGRTVRVDKKQDYVVTGVLKDMPQNSSLQFEWVASFDVYFRQNSDWLKDWTSNGTTTYVELNPSVNPATVDKQLYNFIQQKAPTALPHAFLFSMNDWNLYADFANGKQTGGGRIEYVRLFTAIACIILLSPASTS